jgi:hypothetical protein
MPLKCYLSIFRPILTNMATTRRKKKPTLAKMLQSLDRDEYQAFVQHLIEQDKSVKTQLELFFASKFEAPNLDREYDKLIRRLIRQHSDHGFVHYRDSRKLAQEIDRLVQVGVQFREQEKWESVYLVAKGLLRPSMEVLLHADDSSGSLHATTLSIARLVRELAQAPGLAQSLGKDLVAWLKQELAEKVYFSLGNVGYDLFETYRDLSVKLEAHTQFLELVHACQARLTGEHDDYLREFLLTHEIGFLQSIGQQAEANRLIQQHLDLPKVRQQLLEEVLAQAYILIDQGIEVAQAKGHVGTVANWRAQRLRCAELVGDTSLARQEARALMFARGFERTYYERWKETFPPDAQEEAVEALLTELRAKNEQAAATYRWYDATTHPLRSLGPIYIAEGYWDRLLPLVQRLENLESIFPYHDHLLPHYPEELINLYLSALERAAEEAKSRPKYARLARNMVKLMEDLPQGKERFKALARDWMQRYAYRPAMQDELAKVGEG